MFITIITDCKDDNAKGRQTSRCAALMGVTPSFLGIDGGFSEAGELECAGNLIDILDATEKQNGIIIANVAPRGGSGKKYANGTPFGWFKYGETTVLSSIEGKVLSLVKSLGIAEQINVFDIPTVMSAAVSNGCIDETTSKRIINTQFRSFDFLPRAAAWLTSGYELPTEVMDINESIEVGYVWKVDNFGNVKTTLLEKDVSGGVLNSKWGELKFYPRLKDVPEGQTAAIVGSSGIADKRFIEIVAQGKSAAVELNIKQGDTVLK